MGFPSTNHSEVSGSISSSHASIRMPTILPWSWTSGTFWSAFCQSFWSPSTSCSHLKKLGGLENTEEINVGICDRNNQWIFISCCFQQFQQFQRKSLLDHGEVSFLDDDRISLCPSSSSHLALANQVVEPHGSLSYAKLPGKIAKSIRTQCCFRGRTNLYTYIYIYYLCS